MVIADTGFWIAVMIQEGRHHQRALAAAAKIKSSLVTTWPVITETCYLLLKKKGTEAQNQFIDSIATAQFKVFEISTKQTLRISQLMKQYADLPMDLADASLVVLAEHLGNGQILSADQRDFSTYRWKHREPFENLMFP